MSTDQKIISGNQLATAIGEATHYNFNRQVVASFIEAIDSEGFNIVTVLLPYHNGRDQETPHHRCRVLAKVKDSDVPQEMVIDIAESTYDTFTDANIVMPRIAKASQEIVKDALHVG